MFVHRANKPFKDLICQNKGFKHIESFRPFNRRRRPNRGSSYNIYPEDDEKAFKDIETELESDLDFKLKFFTYVI